MPELRIADFNEVQVSFAGIPIEGWSTGDVITITWEADAFFDQVGNKGDVARGKTNDKRANIEIRLQQTSPVNAALSGVFLADINAPGGAGIGAFLCVDLNGTSLYTAGDCWIQRAPDPVFAAEPGERVWMLRAAQLQPFTGGNL